VTERRAGAADAFPKLAFVAFLCTVVGVPMAEQVPWVVLAGAYAAAIGWTMWEMDPGSAFGLGSAAFFQFFGWMLGLVGTDHFNGKDYPGLYALSIGVCGGVSLLTFGLGFLPLMGRGYRWGVIGSAVGGLLVGFLMALAVTPGFRFLFVVFRLTGGLMTCLPPLCGLAAILYRQPGGGAVDPDGTEISDRL
jgi:hypothetical protein